MKLLSCSPRRPISAVCNDAHGVPSGFGRSWTIDYNGRRWSGRVV